MKGVNKEDELIVQPMSDMASEYYVINISHVLITKIQILYYDNTNDSNKTMKFRYIAKVDVSLGLLWVDL